MNINKLKVFGLMVAALSVISSMSIVFCAVNSGSVPLYLDALDKDAGDNDGLTDDTKEEPSSEPEKDDKEPSSDPIEDEEEPSSEKEKGDDKEEDKESEGDDGDEGGKRKEDKTDDVPSGDTPQPNPGNTELPVVPPIDPVPEPESTEKPIDIPQKKKKNDDSGKDSPDSGSGDSETEESYNETLLNEDALEGENFSYGKKNHSSLGDSDEEPKQDVRNSKGFFPDKAAPVIAALSLGVGAGGGFFFFFVYKRKPRVTGYYETINLPVKYKNLYNKDIDLEYVTEASIAAKRAQSAEDFYREMKESCVVTVLPRFSKTCINIGYEDGFEERLITKPQDMVIMDAINDSVLDGALVEIYFTNIFGSKSTVPVVFNGDLWRDENGE